MAQAARSSTNRGPRVVQQPQSEQQDDLICRLCKGLFNEPKRLVCHHIYCEACIGNLQKGSRDGQTFRCPQPQCRKPCSTRAGQLPTYKDSEFTRRLKLAKGARHHISFCQAPGCNNQPIEDTAETCPHCNRHLCASHLNEHIEQIRQEHQRSMENLQHVRRNLDEMVFDARKQKQQIGVSVEHVSECFEHLHEILRKTEADLIRNLTKTMEELTATERASMDLLQEAAEIAGDEEPSHSSDRLREAAEMWRELQQARQLIDKSEKLTCIPPDVRVEFDLQKLTESLNRALREVQVKGSDLNVSVSQLGGLVVRDSSRDDFKPVQAYLWSKSDGYCIDCHNIPQVNEISRASSNRIGIPCEVLLVTSMQQICVLSLDNRRLGCVMIDQDPTFPVDWFSLCPSQERLAVASQNQRMAQVCDLSGRVMKRIRCQGDVSSISLDADRLIVADAGVMESDQSGSVTIYSGLRFDSVRRIPSHAWPSPIYPTAAVAARRSFFILTSNSPAENSEPSIQEFSDDLELVGEFAVPDMACPGHMCADSAGRIYVSDHPGRLVSVFSTLGKLIGRLDNFSADSCHGLSVSGSSQQRLLVCDPRGGAIHVLTLRTADG